MDMIANLANKITDFQEAAQALFESDMLSTGAAKKVNITRLATFGCDCRDKLKHTHTVTREEDPTKIQGLGVDGYADMRKSLVRAHPDVMLTDFREPHKRFLERISLRNLGSRHHHRVPIGQLSASKGIENPENQSCPTAQIFCASPS